MDRSHLGDRPSGLGKILDWCIIILVSSNQIGGASAPRACWEHTFPVASDLDVKSKPIMQENSPPLANE